MARSTYVSASEAARELGISLPTLYAYVSRGLIRSEPGEGRSRARRYRAEDVLRLRERRVQRRDPEHAAATALDWGAPVLESAITLIQDGRIFYRGHDAVNLAMTRSVAEVAALIWTGAPAHAIGEALRGPYLLPPRCRAAWSHLCALPLVERMQAALPLATSDDPAAFDLRPAAVLHTGARVVRLLLAVVAGEHPDSIDPATALVRGWAIDESSATELLSAALILCADHELNVSAFTARCVASAGATPYAVVQAGLAALSGVRHGGHTERVAALLHEVGAPERAETTIAARLRRGESLPGFGHTLYPAGDPRAAALLRLLATRLPGSFAIRLAEAVATAAHATLGDHPTIDLALVTLANALNLPSGAALAIFALGRSIGWIGHALEQYAQASLIRPRARYVGPSPLDQ